MKLTDLITKDPTSLPTLRVGGVGEVATLCVDVGGQVADRDE